MPVPLIQTVLTICFALVWLFVGAKILQNGRTKAEGGE